VALKDIQVSILRTCEYFTLHGKRDFADVIKDLEMERLFWTIQVDPKCPYKREAEGDLTTKKEGNVKIEVPKLLG